MGIAAADRFSLGLFSENHTDMDNLMENQKIEGCVQMLSDDLVMLPSHLTLAKSKSWF